jgi:hypothetical protein
LAFAALTTRNDNLENKLYEKIVKIPHYNTRFLRLLDKEDEQLLVKENFVEFQQLYKPIQEKYFNDCF